MYNNIIDCLEHCQVRTPCPIRSGGLLMRNAQVVIAQPFPEDAEAVAGLLAQCRQSGAQTTVIPHPYHLPEGSAVWPELQRLSPIAAFFSYLHPRALRALLHHRGISVPEDGCVNLADESAVERALAAIGAVAGDSAVASETTVLEDRLAERWYPVIDLERCRNCGHCLQFCLFGVYSQDDASQVTVTNPDNCKPGCPACSRICPAGAIVFPLYTDDPAICGAPGKFVTLDAEARRMYYSRTGATCPLCSGAEGELPPELAGQKTCPECGRALPQAPQAPGSQPVLDEIDALIAQLDESARRSP